MDIERLRSDLDYWNKQAPDDEATHYCLESKGFEYLDVGGLCDIPKPGRREAENTALHAEAKELEAERDNLAMHVERLVVQNDKANEKNRDLEGQVLVLRAALDELEPLSPGFGANFNDEFGIWHCNHCSAKYELALVEDPVLDHDGGCTVIRLRQALTATEQTAERVRREIEFSALEDCAKAMAETYPLQPVGDMDELVVSGIREAHGFIKLRAQQLRGGGK